MSTRSALLALLAVVLVGCTISADGAAGTADGEARTPIATSPSPGSPLSPSDAMPSSVSAAPSPVQPQSTGEAVPPDDAAGVDLTAFPWSVCGTDVADGDVTAAISSSASGLLLELAPSDAEFPTALVRIDRAVVGDVTDDGSDDVAVPAACFAPSGMPFSVEVIALDGPTPTQLPPVFEAVDSATNVLEAMAVVDGALRTTILSDPDAPCRACAVLDLRTVRDHRLVDGNWRSSVVIEGPGGVLHDREPIPPTPAEFTAELGLGGLVLSAPQGWRVDGEALVGPDGMARLTVSRVLDDDGGSFNEMRAALERRSDLAATRGLDLPFRTAVELQDSAEPSTRVRILVVHEGRVLEIRATGPAGQGGEDWRLIAYSAKPA